jgi:tRNA(adenine34) deaminase
MLHSRLQPDCAGSSMDRASASGAEGWRFESSPARQAVFWIENKRGENALNENWMKLALQLAQRAQKSGEIPVGSVIVRSGQVIGAGWNQKERLKDPTAHAEIIALRRATRRLGDWKLSDSTLFVTLEPCAMCMGAILEARIEAIVYGASSMESGAAQTCIPLADFPGYPYRCGVTAGVLAKECGDLLQSFFKELRR